MAQNITLLGASYSDVPSVDLPKTGGGTARFTDTTDANATASDIAQGKTAYVNDVKVVGTASGGGGTTRYIVLYDNTATITSDPDVNYIWINNQPEAISIGDRYRVTWNGTAYTVTAVNDPTIGSQYGNTFGNQSILGGADDGSNAPFCAFKASWSDNELIVSTSDSAGTISLKIEKIITGGSSATWATGTFTPSSATTSVTFDTTLSTIHGILIVPTNSTPFAFSARVQVGMVITPDCYYKSISLFSNQGGTGFQTPNGSTSNTRFTQNGTSVTVTGSYNFRPMSYTWIAW